MSYSIIIHQAFFAVDYQMSVLSENPPSGFLQILSCLLYTSKQTLEAKLQGIQDSITERKDDAVDFKMMGIDHLFVDKSHQFKNCLLYTSYSDPCDAS